MSSIDIPQASRPSGDVRLYLLGQARAVSGKGEELVMPRKAYALAAYLLLESPKSRLHRGDAAALLWDDSDVERRAGNFRQLLTRLRLLQSSHDYQLFNIGSDYIALDPAATIDVQVFRNAIADKAATQIVAICDAYGGDLLKEQEEGGQKFLQWLRTQRTTLQFEFTAALTTHLESQTPAAYPELAVLAAERLVKLDPVQEVGYRALMRVHAASGDVDLVRKTYARLERALRKEGQTRPTTVTRALFETLTSPGARPQPDEAAAPFEPLSASVGRFLPRLMVLPPPPLGPVSALQQGLADLADELTLALWRTRSFVLLTPRALTADLRALLAANAARDIDYVLELRPQRGAPNGLSLRLVSVTAGEILWAAALDMQEQESTLIGTIIQTVVEQVENHEAKLADQATARVAARRQAFQGQKLLQTLDLDSIRRARNIMKGALATAADCIPALAGLARSLVLEGMLTATAQGRYLEEAEALARRAIKLDPEDFRGYQELGLAHLYARRFDSSIELLRSAHNRNPVDVGVVLDLADAQLGIGRSGEALQSLDQARLLLPLGLDVAHWIAASAHFCLEDYRAAAQQVEAMQHPAAAHRLAAAAYAMLGEKVIAGRLRSAALEFNPGFRVSAWMAVCPLANKEQAQHYEDGLLIAGFQ